MKTNLVRKLGLWEYMRQTGKAQNLKEIIELNNVRVHKTLYEVKPVLSGSKVKP